MNKERLILISYDFALAFKAALAVPRTRMRTRVLDIPVAATVMRSHPISKFERFCRRFQLCCCKKNREVMDWDCTRPESIERFREESRVIEAAPTMTSAHLQATERRQKIFDPNAPAFLAAYPD